MNSPKEKDGVIERLKSQLAAETKLASELQAKLVKQGITLTNAVLDRDQRSKTISDLQAKLKQSDERHVEIKKHNEKLTALYHEQLAITQRLLDEHEEVRRCLLIGAGTSILKTVLALKEQLDDANAHREGQENVTAKLGAIRDALVSIGISDKMNVIVVSRGAERPSRTTLDMVQQLIYAYTKSMQYAKGLADRAERAEKINDETEASLGKIHSLLAKTITSATTVDVHRAVEQIVIERDEARAQLAKLETSPFRRAPSLNWALAPSWAAYAAKRSDGVWYWFEVKPVQRSGGWDPNYGVAAEIPSLGILAFSGKWEDSLVQRPAS